MRVIMSVTSISILVTCSNIVTNIIKITQIISDSLLNINSNKDTIKTLKTDTKRTTTATLSTSTFPKKKKKTQPSITLKNKSTCFSECLLLNVKIAMSQLYHGENTVGKNITPLGLIIFWFRDNQSLLLLLDATWRSRRYQFNILWFESIEPQTQNLQTSR